LTASGDVTKSDLQIKAGITTLNSAGVGANITKQGTGTLEFANPDSGDATTGKITNIGAMTENEGTLLLNKSSGAEAYGNLTIGNSTINNSVTDNSGMDSDVVR